MREQNRGIRRRGMSSLAALALTTLIVTAIGVPSWVDAAPNPLRSKSAEHTVSIAADGSYSVRLDTRFELARDTKWSFGGDIHD